MTGNLRPVTTWFAIVLVWVLPVVVVGSLVILSHRRRNPDPETGSDAS